MIQGLHGYLHRQAAARPTEVAVVEHDNHITFAELDERSSRLANVLSEHGCSPGDRVCLFMPKSIDAVVAMLGTLKAGAVYVPIDTSGPASRTARIAGSADPTCILVDSSARDLLDGVLSTRPDLRDASVGTLEAEVRAPAARRTSFDATDLISASVHPPDIDIGSEDPAHLLFTSGSTGDPKGVIVKHGSVIAFIEWATTYFGISSDDRISGHPPLHFDLSTFDLYGALATGAQLHLVPPELNLLPHKLAAFVRERKLTQWFSVPSTLTHMASYSTFDPDDFPALRRVLFCGEPMPASTLAHWMERLPHVSFTNLYGPTEATIASSYHTFTATPAEDTAHVPIGTACQGEELLLFDDAMEPTPTGEVGHLYIGGVGLSPGYWRDPEKTERAFRNRTGPDGRVRRLYQTGDLGRQDDAGRFYCLGRVDSQIKSRGYRIELGEIETAVASMMNVRECAVVGLDVGGFEGTQICCAVALADSAEPDPRRLRSDLRALLPSYMLPSRWMWFDVLPRNANGKIDRRKLKEMFEESR